MKRFTLTLMVMFSVFAMQAKKVVPLDKQEFKELKQRYKEEIEGRPSIAEQVIEDGFTYYLLKRRNGMTLAVLDKDKNILIKFDKNGVNLMYMPERQEICVPIKTEYGKYWMYVPASQPVFLVLNLGCSSIYKIDGTPLMKLKYPTYFRSYPYETTPSFYYLEKQSLELINDKPVKVSGIYTVDGREIVPYDTHEISSLSSYLSDDTIRFFKTTKKVNGVKYYGAYPNNEADIMRYGSVPTEYVYVGFDYKGALTVKKRPVDEAEEYVKNSDYIAKDRDEGEYYYKLEDYDKVIEYYSKYKEIKPWAAFYSGMAFYQKASKIKETISTTYFVIYERPDLFRYGGVNDFKKGPSDINLMREFFRTSHELLGYYRATGDVEFQKQSNVYHSVSEQYGYESQEEYQKELAKYKKIIEWLNQQEAVALAEMERRRQQQAAIWGTVINAFANSLGNMISGSMSSSYNSALNKTQVSSPSYSSSSSSNSSTSSSSSSTASSSQGSSYESIGYVTALKICSGYGVHSSKNESIELYKYNVTGKVYAKIGGQYHVIHDNSMNDFLDCNVSGYRKALTYGSCTFFFNI